MQIVTVLTVYRNSVRLNLRTLAVILVSDISRLCFELVSKNFECVVRPDVTLCCSRDSKI